MNWFLMALKKYAVFSGRARRAEYWYFALFSFIISVLLWVIGGILAKISGAPWMALLGFIYWLAIIIPSIAVSIRRLHDTDHSGWWILIGFVPIVSLILLYFMVIDGNQAENKYGPNPKGAATAAS